MKSVKSDSTEPPPEWTPPPLTQTKIAGHWSPPPVEILACRAPRRRRSLAVGSACLLLVAAVTATGLQRDKIPGWWAELFHRKPTEDWVRNVALENLPRAIAPAKLSDFHIERITVTRELPGQSQATITGTAVALESLYDSLSLEDPVLELRSQIQALKSASERSALLRQHRGIDVLEPDLSGFAFVKETTANGRRMHFELEFHASRNGSVWQLDTVQRLNLVPPGKPISSFPATVAILNSEEANRQREDMLSKIDTFIAGVSDAENTTKNLPILPPDRALPGERFPQTRFGLMNPDDLQNWSAQDLQYAINEIFARHGAEFGDQEVSMWFHQFNWYRPQATLSLDQLEKWLPDVELENMKSLGYVFLLKQQEEKKKQEAAAAQQRAIDTERRTAAAQKERAAAAQQRAIDAERRSAAAQQQRAAAARQAQQQAAQRAQENAAAAAVVGGVLQGIISSIPRH